MDSSIVLLVAAYARGDDDDGVTQDGGHSPANRFTETYSLFSEIQMFPLLLFYVC